MANQTRLNIVDRIAAYEEGGLTGPQIIQLFQELIISGQVWDLQGSYGRTAKHLVDAGLCHL